MSQKTFVTSTAAKKLGLKRTGTKKIAIQGFGGFTTHENVATVDIELFQANGEGPAITIGAYVKNGPICAPLNAVKLNLDDHPHLKNLVLSDPDIPEGAEIDILIGQAPLQQIVMDRVIRPRGGGR